FVRRGALGRPLVCVFNFQPGVRHHYRVGLPEGGEWVRVLDTDAAAYGGSGAAAPGPVRAEGVPWQGHDHSVPLVLPPLAAVWLRPR
ncbi:alpha amylase C-terminal domain-containing protein, partial [Streptomyces sp. T-3]|nr:alpha amylase C-terminal domain-containing protein [Streptomyces sp. T-3]